MPFLQNLLALHFFHFIFFSLIISLHIWSHLDTWKQVWVLTESTFFAWGLGDMCHPLYLNLPLGCLCFLKRQESMGPEGVICSCPGEEVPWWSQPSLLPQDDHWVSCPNLFHIFRHSYVIHYQFYIILFPTFGFLGSFKAILVVCVFVKQVKGD